MYSSARTHRPLPVLSRAMVWDERLQVVIRGAGFSRQKGVVLDCVGEWVRAVCHPRGVTLLSFNVDDWTHSTHADVSIINPRKRKSRVAVSS